jgi:hypothetical protein
MPLFPDSIEKMLRFGRLLMSSAALCLPGCALNAVRPSTPAAKLELDRNEPLPPGENYYVLVWASQRLLRTPRYSHSFATVVHTTEPAPGRVKILDVHSISWLPATLDIRSLARRPEPGVNLTLEETLEYARHNRERVSLWGPYECRTSFYKRFLVQKEFLETSGVGYQCVDNWGEAARTGDGCDCIHAITDSDAEFGRDNYPLNWFGDSGSEHLAYRLRERGSILNPDVEHPEVLAALDLQQGPIRHRHFDDRLLDFPRVQPGETIFRWRSQEAPQAEPYPAPPFPPPGRHCP